MKSVNIRKPLSILTFLLSLLLLAACSNPNIAQLEETQDIHGLIEALDHEDPQVAIEAAEALGRIGDPSIARFLLDRIDTREEKSVRLAVIAALGEFDDPVAAKQLISVLSHNDSELRAAAIDALAQMGSPALATLVETLQESDPEDADSLEIDGIMAALIGMGEEANSSVLQALRSGPMFSREKLVEVLDATGWQPGINEDGAYYWIAKQEWEECAKIGAASLEPLISVLMDEDLGLQEKAVYGIGLIRDPLALEPLMQVLQTNDDSAELQGAVLEALGEIGAPLVADLEPSLTTLASVCQQPGEVEINQLDKTIPELFYPLVTLDEDGEVNEWTPVFLLREDRVTPRDDLLIACMKQTTRKLETCYYSGGGGNIDRYQHEIEIYLREAMTGSVVAYEVFPGYPEKCPGMKSDTSFLRWDGVVQMDEMLTWLAEYLL